MLGLVKSVQFLVRGLRHYTHGGYESHAKAFDQSLFGKDNLRGKTCLVTGANSGIGYAASLGLLREGARVVLVVRDERKGREAIRQLVADAGLEDDSRLSLRVCDVASLSSVRKLAASLDAEGVGVNVLVNNAGAMVNQRVLTDEGHESNFAVNTLGTFALTRLLMPALERGAPSCVIFVSSGGMLTESLEVDDLESDNLRPFDGMKVYARNKRQQVALCEEFARRYGTDGRVSFYSMHPGWTDTPGVRSSMPGFYAQLGGRMRTPAEGADTIVYLALQSASELQQGAFYLDRVPESKHLWLAGTAYSKDRVLRLWDTLTGMAGLAKA